MSYGSTITGGAAPCRLPAEIESIHFCRLLAVVLIVYMHFCTGCVAQVMVFPNSFIPRRLRDSLQQVTDGLARHWIVADFPFPTETLSQARIGLSDVPAGLAVHGRAEVIGVATGVRVGNCGGGLYAAELVVRPWVAVGVPVKHAAVAPERTGLHVAP